MKLTVSTLVPILICIGAISCNQHKQTPVVEKAQPHSATEIVSKAAESTSAPSTVHEPKGYVPDEQTAIAIAVAVWTPIYGKAQIENEKPFKAKLSNGVWTVMGNLPESYNGGTAVAEISQADGRILKVIHYQ